MKIIAERKDEVKRKTTEEKEGSKMKKIVMAFLVAVVLVNAVNAFAYWKTPAGIEVRNPVQGSFNKTQF